VKVGTKLTFVNDDGVTHTATAPDGAFDTGDIQPGKSVTVTAEAPSGKAGHVAYICSIHQFMKGSITVEP
jgi:plastocyanin